MATKPRFPIGLKFNYRDDRGERTIVDILTTTNANGDVVSIEYKTSRDFCGMPIIEKFCDTSIARSLTSEQAKKYLA